MELAKILEETDRDRLILCSFTGKMKNGHSEINTYSGDYDEGFVFWEDHEPPDSVKRSQAEVARQLRALTDAADGPAERERLNYLTRFVEFLTPYSESWSLAHRLNQKLQQAGELKKQNKGQEARQMILAEGVPLWLKMAPLVREVFLDYQEIVSTRNDQGQLASMHKRHVQPMTEPSSASNDSPLCHSTPILSAKASSSSSIPSPGAVGKST